MMRKFDIIVRYFLWLCSLFVFSCTSEPHSQANHTPTVSRPVLLVQSGVTEDGHPTSAWMEAIRERHDEDTIASLQKYLKNLTSEERLWVDLIISRVPTWSGRIDALSIPFKRIDPPDTITILVGNAGGEDAFTYSDSTIGFDISKLHQIYGSASALENRDRIDRFFSHEMTHILHKAWQKKSQD